MSRPRHPFKFWAITAIGVVFSAVGLFVLAVGPERDTRLMGLACLLLFGPGMAAYVAPPLLTKRGPATVLREYVQTSAGTESAFVFPIPRAKKNAQLVGAAGFAGAALAVCVAVGGGLVMIAIAVFFGLVLVGSAAGAGRAQRLILTPTRVIAASMTGTVELPWETVADAEIFEMPSGRTTVDMLGIKARDRDAAVWTRGRMLGDINRRLSRYDLIMGADVFAGSGEDVVRAIRRYRGDPARRRAIGDDRELARLLGELGQA